MIQTLCNNCTPLCFLPSGSLVCYKRGKLLIFNNNELVYSHQLFSDFKERWFACVNSISRLFRLGIRSAIAIDEDNILLSIGNVIYEYCISERKISKGFFVGVGIRPLSFTEIKDVDGFDNCIVFGGYLGNFEKNPVHIYKRYDVDDWRIVYTFEKGDINHIHNIIPDRTRDCVWIMTGDFDESAAFWKATENFTGVERYAYGKQQYRGCVCYPTDGGLLYATDAPYDNNQIYLLDDTKNIIPIEDIAGSCIYSCQCGDKYVFATSVEPDGRNNTVWNLLTKRKRGAGIKNMYVHIYVGNTHEGFKEIYKEKKDWWPYLFQFGAIRFPYGHNPTSTLYFQPVATNKNDLKLKHIDI